MRSAGSKEGETEMAKQMCRARKCKLSVSLSDEVVETVKARVRALGEEVKREVAA